MNIASGDGTLAGLRDAINAADADVTASILKTSASSYALVLKSREGADHAMRITTEDAGAAGLAGFAYGSVDTDIQTIAASDALLRLDGTTITRDSNSITDLLDGMKLTLKSTSSTASLISARHDTATATAAMQLVVDGLNGMNEMLGSMSKRGVGGEEDGPLAGDPLVRALHRQLRGFTTTPSPDSRTIPSILPISVLKPRVTAPSRLIRMSFARPSRPIRTVSPPSPTAASQARAGW